VKNIPDRQIMICKGKKRKNEHNAFPSPASISVTLQINRILNMGSHPNRTILILSSKS
jgi:hypothetical protein